MIIENTMSKEEALARAEKRILGEFYTNGVTPRLIRITAWWEAYLKMLEEQS